MMKKASLLLLALASFAAASPVMASEANTSNEIYRSKKSIVVNVNCAKTWDVVADFSGIAKWYSGFSQSKRISGSKGQVGEVRELLRSTNGQVVHEELIYINSEEMELAYTHTLNGPVKESIAIVSLTNLAADQCLVSWSNTMKLKKGQDPLVTLDRFNSAYTRVLEDLKKRFADIRM